MTLILYAAEPRSVPVIGGSPPSWAAEIALLEEGVAHEIVWLRFDQDEHRSPSMLALHPAGTVPLLVDGEAVLTDTLAILQNIVSRGDEQRLVSSTERTGAALQVKEAGMAALRALMRSDRAVASWAAMQSALDRWEAGFVRDDGFDLADALVFAYVATAGRLGLSVDSWPRLRTFMDTAQRRPAIARTRHVVFSPQLG